MVNRSAAAGFAPVCVEGYELGYVDGTRAGHRARLAEVANVAFEDALPVRAFPSFRRQRNSPGLWWSATSGRHVAYESWLERDEAMLLDFDPSVVGFASQPFWLFWRDHGRARAHAPDWFARLDNDTGMVIDCRPAELLRPDDALAFKATAQACAEIDWVYRVVHAHDPVLVSNVRWLAAYRHPRHHNASMTAAVVGAFEEPQGLLAGAGAVGDPIGVLPVVYHLLWRGVLAIDLALPLNDATVVWVAESVP
jgi:hypothetical protein